MVIGGQKGLVQESELRIPNMRGIMQSRTKPLQVLEPFSDTKNTSSVSFINPEAKGSCKMVDASNVEELVNLLHNEAKII
jgi:electron transfer flavoprotein beta subunit